MITAMVSVSMMISSVGITISGMVSSVMVSILMVSVRTVSGIVSDSVSVTAEVLSADDSSAGTEFSSA